MYDQAENLRRMMDLARPSTRVARVLAITSGKGGVGKTNLAVNMAIELARQDRRVVILDVDLGLANIDVVMNLNARYNLGHVIRGEKSIRDVMVQASSAVSVVPGASGLVELADLTDGQRANLIESFDMLSSSADMLVFDLAAGGSRNVLGFACAADDVLVISTPEPTSITDAYATIKLLSNEGFAGKIYLVVNMAANPVQANRVAARIVKVALQFLGARVYYIGFLTKDAAVARAVQRRRPFVLDAPRSAVAKQVRKLAKKLVEDNGNAARVLAQTSVRRAGFIRKLMFTLGGVGAK